MRLRPLGHLSVKFEAVVNFKYDLNGGESEIRTREGLTPLPAFEAGAFNRSAISPAQPLNLISEVFTVLLCYLV